MKIATEGKAMRLFTKAALIAAIGLALAAPQAVLAQPTDAEIEKAKTPADHEAIAKSYDAEAKALQEKAEIHKNQAKHYGTATYTKAGPVGSAAMESHCKKIAASYEAAAKDAEAMAAAHRAMAKSAGK